MINALTLISLIPVFVAAINVPRSNSLVKGSSRIAVPRTLQEDSFDLAARQSTCDVNCSNGGCCEGSCCGIGCCPLGWFCDTVGGVTGCCRDGETCGNQIEGCTDITLVQCANYDFCCPPGNTCSLDGNGNAQCNGVTIGNGDTGSTPASNPDTSTPASNPYTSTPASDPYTTTAGNPDTTPAANPTTTSFVFPSFSVGSNVPNNSTTKQSTSTTSSSSNGAIVTAADTAGSGAGRLVVDSAVLLVASLAGVMLF